MVFLMCGYDSVSFEVTWEIKWASSRMRGEGMGLEVGCA